MADFDPAVAQQWNQRLAQDPVYQQHLQAYLAAFRQPLRSAADMRAREQATLPYLQYVKTLGLPAGYAVNLHGLEDQVQPADIGTVHKQEGNFPSWSKYAMMGIGGVAAAPFIAGALGGGAAAGGSAAGTGAGVGIGETAAVAGVTPALAGSLGTGAVAGGGITAGSALSAPSWLSPVLKDSLPAIIGAGGQLGGAAIAAHGNTEAAKIQDAFAREALAYEKERDKYGSATEANRYAAMMSGLSPYVDTGADADVRMAQLLGLPAPQPRATTAPPPQYATPNLPGTPPSAAPANPAGQTAQAVQMRAPDGSTQSVPPDQIAHYEQRGAVRV